MVLQRIANESADGKAATTKIQALQQKKAAELNEKNKQLQSAQQKLEKESTVLSSTAAGELQKQVERLQVDIQRAQQDAQAEVQELQQQLQQEFYKVLTPIIEKVAKDKQVHFIFDAQQSGLVWADPSLNLTADIVAALDASAKPSTASAPAK